MHANNNNNNNNQVLCAGSSSEMFCAFSCAMAFATCALYLASRPPLSLFSFLELLLLLLLLPPLLPSCSTQPASSFFASSVSTGASAVSRKITSNRICSRALPLAAVALPQAPVAAASLAQVSSRRSAMKPTTESGDTMAATAEAVPHSHSCNLAIFVDGRVGVSAPFVP